MFDNHPIGHLPPLLRVEQALAKADLAATANEPGASEALEETIGAFRRAGSPWHLGRALIERSEHLATSGEREAACEALNEADAIAGRLRALPLARSVSIMRAANDRTLLRQQPPVPHNLDRRVG